MSEPSRCPSCQAPLPPLVGPSTTEGRTCPECQARLDGIRTEASRKGVTERPDERLLPEPLPDRSKRMRADNGLASGLVLGVRIGAVILSFLIFITFVCCGVGGGFGPGE